MTHRDIHKGSKEHPYIQVQLNYCESETYSCLPPHPHLLHQSPLHLRRYPVKEQEPRLRLKQQKKTRTPKKKMKESQKAKQKQRAEINFDYK